MSNPSQFWHNLKNHSLTQVVNSEHSVDSLGFSQRGVVLEEDIVHFKTEFLKLKMQPSLHALVKRSR